MTRSKAILPVIGLLAAVAAFYLLVLSPKRDEATRLDGEVAAKQQELDQSRALAATYAVAKANYAKNYTTIVRLGKAVPGDDDIRSLLVQISEAATRSKVSFGKINVGAPSAAPETTPAGAVAPPPGAVSVGSAGFSAMPFSFGFEGSFFRLSDFLRRVERFVTVSNQDIEANGRLLLLGSIDVKPEPENADRLVAQVGAASYLVPPAPAAPGGVPGATQRGEQGAAPPAGGTTTTPTAAITGVR